MDGARATPASDRRAPVSGSLRTARGWFVWDVLLGCLGAVYSAGDGSSALAWGQRLLPVSVLFAVSGAGLTLLRRWPRACVAVVLLPQTTVLALFGHFEAGSSLILALASAFAVALRSPSLRIPVVMMGLFIGAMGMHLPSSRAVVSMAFAAVALGGATGAGRAVRRWRDRTAAANAEVRRLAELAVADAEARLAERQQLSRELHDVLAHGMGVMMLQLGVAQQLAERDATRVSEALAQVRATGDLTLRDLSTLLASTRAGSPGSESDGHPEAPQPTLEDLPVLVTAARGAGRPVALMVHGTPRVLPGALELSAYRVVQEGLTNALKHTRHGPVEVTVTYGHDHLEVNIENAVTDDDLSTGQRQGCTTGGHGLRGLRERVALFGGDFSAGRSATGTWLTIAVFPTAIRPDVRRGSA